MTRCRSRPGRVGLLFSLTPSFIFCFFLLPVLPWDANLPHPCSFGESTPYLSFFSLLSHDNSVMDVSAQHLRVMGFLEDGGVLSEPGASVSGKGSAAAAAGSESRQN